MLSRINLGGDRFAVRADARSHTGEHRTCAVTGRGQSQVSAEVAALVAGMLHTGNAKPGIVHLEQFTEPISFLSKLTAHSTADVVTTTG